LNREDLSYDFWRLAKAKSASGFAESALIAMAEIVFQHRDGGPAIRLAGRSQRLGV
jgi:hypothetical protein